MLYQHLSTSELSINLLEGHSQNRFVVWRILLGILSGSYEEMAKQSQEIRESYYKLKEKLEPKANKELDPSVFNPLSQDKEVNFNQRTLGSHFSRTKK